MGHTQPRGKWNQKSKLQTWNTSKQRSEYSPIAHDGDCPLIRPNRGEWRILQRGERQHKTFQFWSIGVRPPLLLDIPIQWRIQDFPQGGRQLPKLLLFFTFLPKTAWKWKNLDPQGGAHVPGAPPWIRQCNTPFDSAYNRPSFSQFRMENCHSRHFLISFLDR